MRYGLIGEKLGHSFSKIIHEKLADYTYDLIPLSKEELHDFMLEKKFTALNVTIPYKEAVLPYLDEIDRHAKAIGAVNTIVNRQGRLYGYNTDFFGFRYLLEHNGIDVRGKKVLVLGKGGAAKAVLAVLADLGAGETHTVYYKNAPDTITYEDCYRHHTDAQIILNTTPVGMYPRADDCPIDLNCFPKLEGIADVVYNPLRTQFVLEGEKRGIPAAGGLEMLVAQAKFAAEIFLDTTLPNGCIEEITRELQRERSNLVLIGMSGCGKSTLGKLAAEHLQKPFVDTDEEIVKKIGMPIAEYFEKEGETAFRQVETEVLHALSTENNLVISTGGGVVKNPLNIDLLKRNGRMIWLKREVSLLESGNGRPLAPDAAAAEKLYQERLPLYIAAAEAIAENNGTTTDGLCQILRAYEKLLQ
ncbi:MAG: shikimate dehydrogenase [Anaerotignum sp.]|nr:shikimate dehydrogenase [Anaerotignum sp.]